MELVFGNP